MNHFFDSKRWKFFIAGMALIALILLAMGLQGIRFEPSQSINFGSQQEDNSGLPLALPGDRVIILITILVSLAMALLLIPRETRKLALVIFSSLAIFIFLLYIIANAYQTKVLFDQIPGMNTQLIPTPADPAPLVSQPPTTFQPLAEFHPPQISTLILYLVSFAVTLLLIYTVWMIYRWRQSRLSAVTFESLEEIGEAARLALDDLAAGRDGKDAIILCYARMNEVVMQKRYLERGASRTASEFATRLETAGLPRDSVHRLTRLFESARYGVRPSQPVEIDEAKVCLTEIARFCGETI
jgi:hypothetical protein